MTKTELLVSEHKTIDLCIYGKAPPAAKLLAYLQSSIATVMLARQQ